jgi:hypothetical protein
MQKVTLDHKLTGFMGMAAHPDSPGPTGRVCQVGGPSTAAGRPNALASPAGGKAGISIGLAKRIAITLAAFVTPIMIWGIPAEAKDGKRPELLSYGSRIGQYVTITAKHGIDTSKAVIEIRHTRENAKAFCVEYSLDYSEACVDDIYKSLSFPPTVHADCNTMEFYTPRGARYVFAGRSVGKKPEYPFRIISWDTDKEPELFNEYFIAEETFSVLCPAKFAQYGGGSKAEGEPEVEEGSAMSLLPSETVREVRGWHIGYSSALGYEEAYQGCTATGKYQSGSVITLAKDNEGSWWFAVSNERWNSIEGGKQYDVTFRIGRTNWQGETFGAISDIGKSLVSRGVSDEFVGDFARSASLEVIYRGRRIDSFSLYGTRAAKEAVDACYRERFVKDDPFADSGTSSKPKLAGESALQNTFIMTDRGIFRPNYGTRINVGDEYSRSRIEKFLVGINANYQFTEYEDCNECVTIKSDAISMYMDSTDGKTINSIHIYGGNFSARNGAKINDIISTSMGKYLYCDDGYEEYCYLSENDHFGIIVDRGSCPDQGASLGGETVPSGKVRRAFGTCERIEAFTLESPPDLKEQDAD